MSVFKLAETLRAETRAVYPKRVHISSRGCINILIVELEEVYNSRKERVKTLILLSIVSDLVKKTIRA